MYRILVLIITITSTLPLYSQLNSDSLARVWQDEAEADTVRWFSLTELIWQEYMFSDPDTAELLSDEILVQAEEAGNMEWLSDALNTKAISFAIRGQLDSAITLLGQCIDIRRSMGQMDHVAGLQNNLANMYTDKGDFDKAVDLHQSSYTLSKQFGDSALMATNLTNLGIAYQELGRIGKASTSLHDALEIREAMNDLHGIGNVLSPLADVYVFLGDTLEALALHERAVSIFEDLDLKRNLAVAYQSIASLKGAQGDFETAIRLSTDALTLLREVNDVRSISNSTQKLGQFLFKAGREEEAIKTLERSVAIDDSANYVGLLVHSLNALAEGREYQARYDEAQSLFERSLELSGELEMMDAHVSAAKGLYRLFKRKGHYQKALAMNELAESIESKLNSDAAIRSALRDQFDHSYRSQLVADSLALVQERALRDLEASSNQRSRLFLITGILLILGFAAFAWDRYRNARKQKVIIEKNAAQLAELDEVKSRFFTNISHEFRTPLTLILGPAKRLLEVKKSRNEQDDIRELSLITRNSERLQELIDQILELNKLEAGKVNTSNVQGDVVALLDHLFSALHSLGEARGIEMKRTGQTAPVIADHDREMLTKIVHNLVSNAAKFTAAGGSITLDVGSNDNEFIFSVLDTGTGIFAEDLPHVFDRFYQSAETPDDQVGTGVGLALTRELVSSLNGAIKVESERGKGSNFTVTLPITRNAPLTESNFPEVHTGNKRTPAQAPLEHGDPPSEDAPLVLIVEDNPDMAEHVARCLGTEVTKRIAENGVIGVNMATELVPDLIVTDVMMPEKDGFTLCEELKNDERTSHIPIVMLTARADVEDRLSGLRRGADDYLSKPFNGKELKLRVRNLLEMRKRLISRYAQGGPLEVDDDVDLALEDKFIIKLRDILNQHLDDSSFGPNQIAEELGVSRSQFFRKVKALTDESPSNYVRKLRLIKANDLLMDPDLRVSEVAFMVGFNDPKYFTRSYTKEFGVSPSAERSAM